MPEEATCYLNLDLLGGKKKKKKKNYTTKKKTKHKHKNLVPRAATTYYTVDAKGAVAF